MVLPLYETSEDHGLILVRDVLLLLTQDTGLPVQTSDAGSCPLAAYHHWTVRVTGVHGF